MRAGATFWLTAGALLLAAAEGGNSPPSMAARDRGRLRRATTGALRADGLFGPPAEVERTMSAG